MLSCEIDNLECVVEFGGRVCIPQAARNILGVKQGSHVMLERADEHTYILRAKEHVSRCPICGAVENIIDVNGIEICKKCRDILLK